MKASRLIIFSLLLPTIANSSETLNEIELKTKKEIDERIFSTKVTSDSAQLFNMTPGMSFQSGGGISSLPIIHGLADDRVKIKVDGATITSSCSNHMNPALSYIDPGKVSKISVLAGITPVSNGGDSIGGTIIVKSKDPTFAESSESIHQSLRLKTYFKSNNENRGIGLNYEIANKDLSLSYSGTDDRANNYRNGRGKRLKGTLHNQNNQMITLGKKISNGIVALKLSRANVPYQGFVNQYMDLEDNVANFVNLSFQGELGLVQIESSLFYQHTNHYMDKLGSERLGMMPMYTRSDEMGYNLRGEFELSKYSNFIFGTEFARYRLNDWWPPVTTTVSGMGPGTFESINDGKRDRLAFFMEIDSNWSSTLSTNFGLRTDLVSMNTGDVKGYNDTSNLPADASAFNSRSHKKYDENIDATLGGKIKLSSRSDIELGLARKTRSPNLYERYAWAGSVTAPSGATAMDMRMINWFGDGNGYVGDLDLKPEVAHKVSASFILHDELARNWEVKITPYYSEVQDFIDADLIGSFNGRNYLKFANHDAVIFGMDLSIGKKFLSFNKIGDFSFKAIAGHTRGYRKDGKADLYHLMPLNGKIHLVHEIGKWTTDFSASLVHKKEIVNELRLERKSAGYAIFDLGTSYQVSSKFKIDFGITNILDHHYDLPLGGVDIVNSPMGNLKSLAGMGRSYNTALTMDFL